MLNFIANIYIEQLPAIDTGFSITLLQTYGSDVTVVVRVPLLMG